MSIEGIGFILMSIVCAAFAWRMAQLTKQLHDCWEREDELTSKLSAINLPPLFTFGDIREIGQQIENKRIVIQFTTSYGLHNFYDWLQARRKIAQMKPGESFG